jgi:uncharacterized membrane protein
MALTARRRRMRPLWALLLVLILTLPVLLALIYLGLIERVFRLLGLSPLGALVLLAGSLIGGLINIPLTRRRIVVVDPEWATLPEWARRLAPIFHYYPPVVNEQVIAINVGGALIPIAFSIYLLTLPSTSWIAALIATVIVAAVAKALARPLTGVGVAMPVFIPLVVTALAARLLIIALGLPSVSAAPVAYIAGTLGTLIGADLLNLPRILRGSLLGVEGTDEGVSALAEGSGYSEPAIKGRTYVASIGGAGVFDGVFFTSIVAPLLAAL